METTPTEAATLPAPPARTPVGGRSRVFRSFVQGGIECSTHRRADGVRVDPMAGAGHDVRFAEDYAAFAAHGVRTLRSGVRWPHAEPSPGAYRLSGVAARAAAARRAGVEVVWDLCHYGYPDDLDPFGPAFVTRFAAFADAATRALAAETDGPLWLCPVNEISFWAWAGGDVAYLNPHARGRGFELKVNLVRAALAAMDAAEAAAPHVRFLHAEPLIHVAPPVDRPDRADEAASGAEAQFQAFDLLAGRLWPGVGGREDRLGVLGLNVYPDNQWILGTEHRLRPGDAGHRPLRAQLAGVAERYPGVPLAIAETGAEGEARAPWLAYVLDEVRAARAAGVPVEGVCLYPALDYPGWDDGRWCPTGLLAGRPGLDGPRHAYAPLADLLARATPHVSDRPGV